MSSNSSYIADLNLLVPPPIPNDDLSADFEFWRNAEFIEMPPRLEINDELATSGDVDLEDNGSAESPTATATTATASATATTAQAFGGLELMGLSDMNPTAAATAAALAMNPLFAFNPMAAQALQQPLLLPSVGSAAPAAPTSTSGYPTIYPAPPVRVSDVAGTNDTVNVSTLGSIQPKPSARKSSSTSRRSTPRPPVATTASVEGKASDTATTDADLVAKMASEEDKRRRNTAASARFRIKKKMKEQALEHTAREMTEKVQQLQERVKELELENKWLRDLVVEKDPVLLEFGRSSKRKRAALSNAQNDDEEEEEEEIEERDKRKVKKKTTTTISTAKEVDRNRNDHKKQDQKRPKRNKKEVQEAKAEDEVIKPVLIKVEQLDVEDEKPI